MNQHQLINDYIATQILGTIATVAPDGTPQSALVAFTEMPDNHLIFGTANTSRKYQNLQHSPQVAIVFGNDVRQATTIQYQGIATELIQEEKEQAISAHLKKNPFAAKFAHQPEQTWWRVQPAWIRYANLAAKPPVQFEVTFPIN